MSSLSVHTTPLCCSTDPPYVYALISVLKLLKKHSDLPPKSFYHTALEAHLIWCVLLLRASHYGGDIDIFACVCFSMVWMCFCVYISVSLGSVVVCVTWLCGCMFVWVSWCCGYICLSVMCMCLDVACVSFSWWVSELSFLFVWISACARACVCVSPSFPLSHPHLFRRMLWFFNN